MSKLKLESRMELHRKYLTISFWSISGAILLSLYYLFLWDPYKNTGQPPTQIPHAQANSPPTPSPSSTTTPTSPVISNSPSNTLSDSALDNIVEDLNNGAQPKALAMAMRVLSQKESIRNERHLHTNPYKYLSKGKVGKSSLDLIPSTSVKIQVMGGKVWLRCKLSCP